MIPMATQMVVALVDLVVRTSDPFFQHIVKVTVIDPRVTHDGLQ